MFDFSIITSWIHQTLTSVMPEGLAVFIECVVIGVEKEEYEIVLAPDPV